MIRLFLVIIGLVAGSAVTYAQIVNPSTPSPPGGNSTQLQFNTNGIFGGIGTVTSDSANVGFATSSKLILYGFTVGDCVKIGTSNQLADSGGACGGSGSPGGTNGQVQFNTNGTFGGISNITSDSAGLSMLTATVSSNFTAAIAAVPGFLTASGANLQTATVGSLGGSTQCVESIAGVLTGFGSPCGGTSATNIAAGSNITTSGTTSNVTVNVVATPSFTTVIASGNVTAGTAQFTGAVSGTTAVFQTITDALLGGCLQGTAGVIGSTGVNCATQTSTPSIAAGTNITTSGTAANTTINVVATPTFTSVTTTLASVTGWLTAAGVNAQTETLAGALNGSTANFTGNLTAPTAQITGFLTAAGANLQTATLAGVLNGSTAVFTGNLTSGGAQFTGAVTGTTAVFQTITDALLGGCLNATSGVISSTGVSCATQTSTPSIAAGTNITTSGTAANTTINLVATPSVTTLIASGNLTAATAQFSGFLTAGGASLSGLTIVTATHTGNLTGTTANFSGNLTGTTAQFTGAVTGTSAQFQTYNGATANLTSNLTGSTAQFSGQVTGTTAVFQTVTAQNFTTTAAGFVGTPAAGSGTAFLRGDNTFSTPTTLGLAASTTTTPLGWINVNGNGRLTADSVGFITTGVVNLITLSGLVAGRTYYFNAELPLKSATASTGGIALRVGGGATATSIVYDGWIVDSGFNGIKGNTQATALSTSVANSSITGTTSHARLVGTITVNAAGSIVLQASAFSTVTAASAVTVGRGATFTAQDIP